MEIDNNIYEKLPFWQNLTDNEKNIVRTYSVIQKYEKGKIIHSDNEKCLGMFLLISGEIRTYVISPEGREITLFKLHNNDCCVMSASCVISQLTFSSQMIAQNDCEILLISANIFSKLVQNNIYVKCYMYEVLTERFSSVMQTMQEILFMGFDQRLANFLISETDRTGTNEIKMTHEQIAQHINSAREVVARMLKRFSNDGIVELKRGTIIIKDKNKLIDLQ